MRSFSLKLRLIYYPFLLIAVGFILAYSLLNGWLTITTATIPLKEKWTDLWVPLGLPFILLAIWLLPGIRLLNLKSRRANNLPLLYLIIAGFAIGVPAILLQSYLRTAMGKLTPLQSINQIRENKLTKYYTAENFYIDTSRATFKYTATVTGKTGALLNWAAYIACPMFDRQPEADSPGTAAHLVPQAWACIMYKKQISNRLEKWEENEEWNTFVLNSRNNLHRKNFNRLVYLERIGNTDDRDNYEKGIINNRFITTIPGPLLLLEPKFTAFEARNGHKLAWVFGAFGIGALVWLIMLAIPKLKQSALEDDESPATLKKGIGGNDLKEVGALLLPRPGYMVTPFIIDVNILIFILMVLAGKGFIDFQAADLLTWGANFRPLTTGAGQWWRLVTSTFLHAGIMHLLFNMAGLLFAGILLEPALGKMRLATVYLLTGIAASLTSLWWHPATVSVGASGAIFGLYGVFLALLTTRYFPPVIKRSFTAGVVIFIGGNLLLGLAGGIDNAAHVGGLISGVIAGYILYPGLKTSSSPSATSILYTKDSENSLK